MCLYVLTRFKTCFFFFNTIELSVRKSIIDDLDRASDSTKGAIHWVPCGNGMYTRQLMTGNFRKDQSFKYPHRSLNNQKVPTDHSRFNCIL